MLCPTCMGTKTLYRTTPWGFESEPCDECDWNGRGYIAPAPTCIDCGAVLGTAEAEYECVDGVHRCEECFSRHERTLMARSEMPAAREAP